MIYLSGESPKIWGNSGGEDEIQIYAQTKTLLGELMVLIAVYCIFDLAYPNMYSQLLGICQEYILIQSSLIG